MENTGNYERIEKAIDYLKLTFRQQPSLEEVAAAVHLSPFHFQKMFTDWAGVSPKKFLQYLSIDYARSLLRDRQTTLFDTALETGLSGTSRLHDLFINIEGMTPGEYKNGGQELSLQYSFSETPFGTITIASTYKGICHMAFCTSPEEGLSSLRMRFPNARCTQHTDSYQQDALSIFTKDWSELNQIKLHLKGTSFQIKVWEALLQVPIGQLTTYASLAAGIDNEKASRAVGSAVGDNPVAFLIPCHRVIRSTGEFGHYHWGSSRKKAMIGWEMARIS